ncbi:MAG TPA: polyprenyl diphosphate synthase, partial [Candidatus Paceibacterota bacterium]|nr:polyprenyl diphosphate synthase [Candidatus Paceibacterota bacterium]
MKEEMKKPKCVGMIMDGNRRWAKERGMHSFQGHQTGYNKTKEVADWCIQQEIPNLILYAFSIENWKRSEEEVTYLMGLIKLMVSKEFSELKEKGIRISFIGDMSLVGDDIKKLVEKAEKESLNFKKLHLVIAFSYSGRREIINAVKEIAKTKNKQEIENLTE